MKTLRAYPETDATPAEPLALRRREAMHLEARPALRCECGLLDCEVCTPPPSGWAWLATGLAVFVLATVALGVALLMAGGPV